MDNEVKGGVGNHLSFGDFGYDTRVARRFNLDPIDQIYISNYAGFGNNPIFYNDPTGYSQNDPNQDPNIVKGTEFGETMNFENFNFYWDNFKWVRGSLKENVVEIVGDRIGKDVKEVKNNGELSNDNSNYKQLARDVNISNIYLATPNFMLKDEKTSFDTRIMLGFGIKSEWMDLNVNLRGRNLWNGVKSDGISIGPKGLPFLQNMLNYSIETFKSPEKAIFLKLSNQFIGYEHFEFKITGLPNGSSEVITQHYITLLSGQTIVANYTRKEDTPFNFEFNFFLIGTSIGIPRER